jgi:hypothetical protein
MAGSFIIAPPFARDQWIDISRYVKRNPVAAKKIQVILKRWLEIDSIRTAPSVWLPIVDVNAQFAHSFCSHEVNTAGGQPRG